MLLFYVILIVCVYNVLISVRLCRSSSQAPEEATMLQLNEELAYLHQAFAFSQDLRDRLAQSLVGCATQFMQAPLG